MSAAEGRLRVPPRERFAGDEHIIDLETAFAGLPSESVLRHGHMQKVLYRLGRTTTAIFAFEAGGRLEQYTIDAQAIVHVIEGRVRVCTPDSAYELTRNQMVMLDPGVPHDVEAVERTRLLLTVVLREGELSE